ncbi:hypothetical protein AVEN_115810-1 [Araneus ventricosus]|uniref:Uncharacterized protein n=1 Tax=Araneus ventricosus TaxID=182803 RepID=A0A4Y2DF61_ARAVE|nr:hypothetical protein AVEN_115810-1 [Araneus ventricosus]
MQEGYQLITFSRNRQIDFGIYQTAESTCSFRLGKNNVELCRILQRRWLGGKGSALVLEDRLIRFYNSSTVYEGMETLYQPSWAKQTSVKHPYGTQ